MACTGKLPQPLHHPRQNTFSKHQTLTISPTSIRDHFQLEDIIVTITQVPSATITGPTAYPVTVEVSAHPGLPSETIVGLPDAVVKESRSRIRSAIRHCGFEYPARAITINLAPAELRKEGPFFDLPIAIGILQTSGQLPQIPETLFVGELGLAGDIRPIRGVISMTAMAIRLGYKRIIVPFANGPEASLLQDIEVVPVSTISDIKAWTTGNWTPAQYPDNPPIHRETTLKIEDVKGQWLAKRALEIAAAGSHNILLIGPPGSGKSMILQRLPVILPELTWTEAIESLELHALIPGNHGKSLCTSRPFRSPHHTISYAGMVGGGANPLPGEISLSHNGILFLDELPEYPRRILELLRQPLEDRRITISRATATVTYPANFSLVAAMNPCPCGYHGDTLRLCTCQPIQIAKYIQRISGPLLDRIDLIIDIPRPDANDWSKTTVERPDYGTAAIKERVHAARLRQNLRGSANATLTAGNLQQRPISPGAHRLLNSCLARGKLTGRSHDKVFRVAQTIADLAESEMITETHVSEALQLRGSIAG